MILFTFTVKCEPPSHRENVVIIGFVSSALENAQISISCLPGYVLPHEEVISTCTSEAMWSPDLSLQLDLECQHKLGDCRQLSLVSGAYRILNETSYSEGSLVEFQCVHSPYKIDPLFITECQAGQWNPHPRDICGQGVIIQSGYTFMIISTFTPRRGDSCYCIFGSSDSTSLYRSWDS
jgi:hypothetical protein